MKKLLFLFILTLLPMMASAEDGNVESLSLVVNGKPVVIYLAEHPVITYTNDQLHISTQNETIDVPIQSITSFEFPKTSTEIESTYGNKTQLKDGEVKFCDLKPGSIVYVYAVNGNQVGKALVDNNGTVLVNTKQYPSGIYLIKTTNQTIKITNK